jgi:putative DeoR family transcriptional regulator (stage III sporulation protein D)
MIVKGNIEERACQMAQYIVENRATVRAAAQKFGISKSTVHTVVHSGNIFRCRKN